MNVLTEKISLQIWLFISTFKKISPVEFFGTLLKFYSESNLNLFFFISAVLHLNLKSETKNEASQKGANT